MEKRDHSRHVLAACQSYLVSNVQTSLECLRDLYATKHIDENIFEEASIAIELLHIKLARVSSAVSDVEYHNAAST